MGVIDEVGPDKGVPPFRLDHEALIILGNFNGVMGFVLNVERMLNFPLINKPKMQLVGVVMLIDIDPNILHYTTPMLRLQLQ